MAKAVMIKFKLNKAGVRELLKSPEIAAECGKHATDTAAAAGEGYVVEPRNYKDRSGYAVYPDTFKARRDNFDNNTLLKSLR